MKNWHDTLSEALDAGKIPQDAREYIIYMPYNSEQHGAYSGLFVTVTRDHRGMYETAISYKTKMQDTPFRVKKIL